MATKGKTVKYIAVRFIDLLTPGDEVPEDDYTEDHLKRMVDLGLIREEVEETAKPAAAKKQ